MNPVFFRTKTFSCFDIIRSIATQVLIENKPADRAVASYFKMNKKYGSKDRKFLYEVVFSFFRWLGWTRYLLKESCHSLKLDLFAVSDRVMLQIILSSLLLDNLKEKEILLYWMNELKVNHSVLKDFENAKKVIEKVSLFKGLLRFFGIHKEVLCSELIPEWAYAKIPADAEKDKFIEYGQTRPPIWLRIQAKDNSLLLKELAENNVVYRFHATVKNALCIMNSRQSIYNFESFNKGFFEIQDIGSQVIGLVASPKPGQRWWDCCAGAGGKTLQLSTIMENKGKIIASDIREYKLDDLKKRARRDEKSNIECRAWDGDSLRKKKSQTFDGVLVDAPCSCSGTWRRNPDARWHTEPSEVEELSKIQSRIIRNVSSVVKSGGVLVYATCSFFEEENIKVIKDFLTDHQDFELDPFTNPLNGNQTRGFLQVYPWDADCDSMFVARLVRN